MTHIKDKVDLEKTMRDEFEKDQIKQGWYPDSLLRFPVCDGKSFSGGYRKSSTHEAWMAWKAAHELYAPRCLPIDEKAKDGRCIDLWHPELGRLTGYKFNENSFFGGHFHLFNGRDFGLAAPPGCTHYMPIPDSPHLV